MFDSILTLRPVDNCLAQLRCALASCSGCESFALQSSAAAIAAMRKQWDALTLASWVRSSSHWFVRGACWQGAAWRRTLLAATAALFVFAAIGYFAGQTADYLVARVRPHPVPDGDGRLGDSRQDPAPTDHLTTGRFGRPRRTRGRPAWRNYPSPRQTYHGGWHGHDDG